MDETTDSGDVESYILSSKYRSTVLEHLAESGRATPKDISDDADAPRPHVSRALSELREKGVVELRVPEGRTVGRYYGLTGKGEDAWPEIKDQVRSVEWAIEEPSTPAARSVVETAKDEFEEGLRCVGVCDGESVTLLYVHADVRAEYSDEEFEEAIRTLVFDHSLDELDMPREDCWSGVLHFDDLSVLSVRVEEETRVSISFDRAQNVAVPEFAESVAAVFDE